MASGSIAAFNPESTVSIAASTTSAAVPLTGTGPSLLIYNSSSSTAFLSLGAGVVGLVATAGALPVPAGSQVLLGIGITVNAAAVVLNSGTGTVFLTRGSGSVY